MLKFLAVLVPLFERVFEYLVARQRAEQAKVEMREREKAVVIENVQKANDAVTHVDDARTERLRSRFDRKYKQPNGNE